ncbi:hypothetical protein AAHA92_33104 [Salvia divinorum]|uniref:Cytochrome P450 n=1 Tax=Salvia divinorum TaxID=28513 RepID=A0ABD1FQH9_SALDI
MMIFLVLISLPLMFIYILYRNQETAKQTFPPGPPRLPLIGNLHQLATTSALHIYLLQLSHHSHEISRPQSFWMKKLTYKNSDIVFSPFNDYWREMRKITTIHFFSQKKVQSFSPIREDEISLMMARVSKFAESHQVVNLSEVAAALNRRLICRIAFGKKYEDDGIEMRRFEELIHEFLGMTLAFFVSDYFPLLGWVDKLVGSTKKLDRTFENFDSFYQELIDDHLDPARAKSKTMGEEDDILDILIQLKQKQEDCSINLTWDNIKAILMNFFVAGADTSSSLIIWTMTALMKAPNVMKNLQNEIRSLIGKKGRVDEDDLPKLRYLKAVVNESLRLYPPGPLLIPRESIEKCVLNGYKIEPKTMVYVNVFAIGRDPEYWNNPEEFLPERFLNNKIDVRGQDFELIPFGSGRRMCPGISIGIANVELTVANLVYNFNWELPPGILQQDVDTHPSPGLAVNKKNALRLVPNKYHP